MKKIILIVNFFFSFLISSIAQTPGWTKMKALNDDIASRHSSQMVTYNNKIYFFGGYGSSNLNDFWEYNPQNKTFTELNSLPGEIFSNANASGGSMWVIGNNFYYMGAAGQFREYNFITKIWSVKPNFPSTGPNINVPTTFVINNIFYAISDEFNTMYSFDPSTNLWTQKANYPGSIRRGGFSFSINGKGYKGGGSVSPNTFPLEFYEYNPITNTWTQKANMPSSLISAVATGCNGKGYVGTGQTPLSVSTGVWYEYNPDTNSWVTKASAPSVMQSNGTVLGDNIFLFGGKRFLTGEGFTSRSFINRYNTLNNTWSTDTAYAGGNRTSANGMHHNGKIYIVGGDDSEQRVDTWEYTIATDSWLRKANRPGHATSLNGQAIIGSSLYILGGYVRSGTSNLGAYSNSLIKYDAVSNIWETKAPYPSGAGSEIGVFTINGEIYAGCGFNGSSSVQSNSFNKYNPSTNTWTSLASCPKNGAVYASFVLGDIGYFIFGTNYAGTGEVWAYNRINNTWTKKQNITDFSVNGGAQAGPTNTFVKDGIPYLVGLNGQGGAGFFYSKIRKYNETSDTWSYVTEAPFNKKGQTVVSTGNDIYIGFGQDENITSTSGTYYHLENDWYKLNLEADVSAFVGDKVYNCLGEGGLQPNQTKTFTDDEGKLFVSLQAGTSISSNMCIQQRSLSSSSVFRENKITDIGNIPYTTMLMDKNFTVVSGGPATGSKLRMYFKDEELNAFVTAFNAKYGSNKTINDIKIISNIDGSNNSNLNHADNFGRHHIYTPSVNNYKTGNKSLEYTFLNGESLLEVYAALLINAQNLSFPTITTKTYGVADFVPGATSNNSSIPITYTSSNTAIATITSDGKIRVVGAGTVTIIANQAGNANFSAAIPVSQTLTVTPASLTVNAESKTKMYGAANPTLTVTYSGFLNGDDATKLTTQPIVSTAALLASPVNTYPITVSGAASTNYTFNYTASALTVTKAPLTITAKNLTKEYDGVSFTGGNGVTFTGLVAGDTETNSVTGTLAYSGPSQAARNTGKYVITPSGFSAVNYNITFVNGELSIDSKPITVTANALSKIYRQVDPTLTYILTGSLITGDVISGSLSRAAGENAGTYAITQGTLAAGSNYSITFVAANLTVTPKPLTVTVDAKNKIYRAADPSLTYTLTGTLESGDSFTGSLSRVVGENVGTYVINRNTLTAGNNYAITFVGADFTITAKPLTVTAAGKSKAYGSTDPTLTYTLTGTLESGDAITGALSRAAGENAGNYAITQGTLTAGGNYAITFASANLTINKVGLTITADNKTRVQGVANPTLTASFSGFVNSETSSVLTAQPLLVTTANLTSAPGTYPITTSGATALNYDISYVAGTLTVSPALPIITSFTPTTSTAGATINITGNNFTGATSVSFGGTSAASFTINSPTSITAVVGTGASGNISISSSLGNSTLAGYTFVPKPTISASGQTTFASGGSVILTANPGTGYTYKWFKDGTEIPIATSASYTASTSGAYTVTITANGVNSTSNATNVDVIYTLPANNFKITYNGETCKTSNNGKISIEAIQSKSYTALLTGNGLNLTKPFTTTVDFADLQAGTYNVCITVAGEASYKQCFDVVVTEPKDLSVFATVDKDNKVSVALGGSDMYFVELNGVIIKTEKESLELALKPGENILKVSTTKECQGVFEKSIMVYDKPILYPNPFVSEVNLFNLPSSSTTVEVLSLDGKVIFKKNYENETKAISVELDQLNTGAYILKASSNNSVSIFKIIKK